MFSILEICAFISYIYFKTIVIDNLHLFRKWRGSSPVLRDLNVLKKFLLQKSYLMQDTSR